MQSGHRFQITNRDWNRFCREAGVGSRPCPMCGTSDQFGASADEAQVRVLVSSTHSEPLAQNTLSQECRVCGHVITFGMGPLVRFMGWSLP